LSATAETAVDLRAQAVRIGAHTLGFTLGWARLALDHVERSSAPGAPPWLVGTANVEGDIVPVVDLANWMDSQATIDLGARDLRMLVGGQGSEQLGLLFRGLPRLIRVAAAVPNTSAPPALAPLVLGTATDDDTLLVLDGAALLAQMTQTLDRE
jgi:chemotaxis signal transduction protein